MKLKRKLILAGLAFGGFCFFKSGCCEARPKSGSYSKVLKNNRLRTKNSRKSLVDDSFFDFRELNKLENLYYENGLDKCEDKPFFYIAAEGGVMEIYFSPSMLEELSPSAVKLNNFKIKITDSYGRKYVIENNERNTSGSLIDGRDFYYRVIRRPRGNDFVHMFADGFFVDKGFVFNVGEEYLIELFDSNGNKVVEESCCCNDLSKRDCVPNNIIKQIAHPKKFNKFYWKECLNNKNRSQIFAQIFNKKLNDYHNHM